MSFCSMLTPLASADATPAAAVSVPSGSFSTGGSWTGRSPANSSASAAQSRIISCSCRPQTFSLVTMPMTSTALS